MKKSVLIAGMLTCSLLGFSQKNDTPAPSDTPARVTIAAAPADERIARLEAEVASLKTSQSELKKQLSEIQSTLTGTKKKKLTVNRAGSKQVNWTTNE